jgi:hypothetical protein
LAPTFMDNITICCGSLTMLANLHTLNFSFLEIT